jgi:hypothetical protein
MLDYYVQYIDTACELAKLDKVQVIEIVKNDKKYDKQVIGLVMKKERREIILIFPHLLFSFQNLVGIYMKM